VVDLSRGVVLGIVVSRDDGQHNKWTPPQRKFVP